MQLYTYFRSSASFRLRIALALKGLDYEPAFIHLKKAAQLSPSYLSTNPQGLVPALVLDNGQVLTQSLAIIEYLEETHPKPPLMPHDAVGRAQVRAAAQLIACEIQPLNNLRVFKYLKQPLGLDQDMIHAWTRHWIAEGFAALEQMVKGKCGPYCFGDQITLADVFLVPQMWNARRFETSLTAFPHLLKIDAALQKIPAFANAAPEAQPDYEEGP